MTFLNRLEQIRLKTGITWSEVAAALGVSRTQLHLIRKGEYEPSQRVLLRLEQAELNAGLRKPPGEKQGILRLLESVPSSHQSIGVSEHDAGWSRFRLNTVWIGPQEFTREGTRQGTKCFGRRKLLVDLLWRRTPKPISTLSCHSSSLRKSFWNKLEPTSFLRLLDAALECLWAQTGGPELKDSVKRLLLLRALGQSCSNWRTDSRHSPRRQQAMFLPNPILVRTPRRWPGLSENLIYC